MPQIDIDPSTPWVDLASFEKLANHPATNTEITYLYRDGSNNKQSEQVILPGAINPSEIATISAHLDEDGFFIPGQVGLDDLQGRFKNGWDDDADHPFHEFCQVALTLTEATSAITPEELARRFATVSWDEGYRP